MVIREPVQSRVTGQLHFPRLLGYTASITFKRLAQHVRLDRLAIEQVIEELRSAVTAVTETRGLEDPLLTASAGHSGLLEIVE